MKETHSNTHWLPWDSASFQYCCLIATLLSWLNLARHCMAQLHGGLIWCLAAACCLLAIAVLIEAGLFGGRISSSASESSSVVSGTMVTRHRPASHTGATGPSDSGSDSSAGGGERGPWSASDGDRGPWSAGGWDGASWSAGGAIQVLGWQVVEMVELWWLELEMVEGWLHGS